jgi:hypothetical protein
LGNAPPGNQVERLGDSQVRPESITCSLTVDSPYCQALASKHWGETAPLFADITTTTPLTAGTQYVLIIDCDRRRRLFGVKISHVDERAPRTFTIVDFSHGSFPFQVTTTGKTRIEFLWQVFDLPSAKLLTDEQSRPYYAPEVEPMYRPGHSLEFSSEGKMTLYSVAPPGGQPTDTEMARAM